VELLLVRHCAASGQEPEAALTLEGVQQAERLAERLAREPIDRVVSSPYRRAIDSIAPLAARRGLDVEVDPRLAERRMSAQPIDHWRDLVRRSFDEPDLRAPGGESARETLVRGRAALDDVIAGAHRLPVVVSHGQLLALLLHELVPGFGYAGWESLRNPDVFRVAGEPGAFRVERLDA
jgi:2,3-bisphosphoglycerate-dependent phosphoglycerate mutase